MPKVTYQIDGADFSTLEEFYDRFYGALVPGQNWGKNLDALEDLVGGCVFSGDAFRLIWRHADLSRKRLGYSETVRQLEERLQHCHSTARSTVSEELEKARLGEGPTVFDWLITILSYPPLELVLE